MDNALINEINKLVEEITDDNRDKTLQEVDKLLFLLDYQAQFLRYKIGIAENPNNKQTYKALNNYNKEFSSSNALSSQQLIIPLLLYLFQNHKVKLPAYEFSLSFMQKSKIYLKPGDYARLKTGGIRFITNTRFASDVLRELGLIRSDKKTYFKIWELSLFGILVAALMYKDNYIELEHLNNSKQNGSSEKATVRLMLWRYIDKIRNINEIINLIDFVYEERQLFQSSFPNFENEIKKFRELIKMVFSEDGINRKQNERILKDFIHASNEDKLLSEFTDKIILRKDIKVNLEVVYNIIKR